MGVLLQWTSAALLVVGGIGAAASFDHEPRNGQSPTLLEGLRRRQLPDAPNGYAPDDVDCPSTRPFIRNGSAISPEEEAWLPKRRNGTIPHIRDLLSRLAIPDFDSDDYLRNAENDPTALPNIGIAVSGGGYRAMLTGAGAVAAWDIRSSGSDSQGNLGGLLQSATYFAGLSGGGWLVNSLYANNFTSVQDSVQDSQIWEFENSILHGPDQYGLVEYYTDIFDDVDNKKDAGYQTSITDYWGRMLSYQLINASNGGPSYTFSSIADQPGFANGSIPLPFLVADSRSPGQVIVSLNSTVFDFTPWELGSYDPALRGYAPLKYLGSKFRDGQLPKDADCVSGFDNSGFVMGTSSSLFNQFVLYLNDPSNNYVPSDVPSFVRKALSSILNSLGDDNNDIADYTPNPFRGWADQTFAASNSSRLTLVDGGEDLQNVPYHPLIYTDRNVDVVFSVDSSADTTNGWPNGASAVATYERSLEDLSNGSSFPVVPGQDTFINLGLNTRPTFFGCNVSNTSQPAPLIVYLPNYPYVTLSNLTTFTLSVNTSERDAMVQNGYAVATQLNATRDKDWPVCVGCAMLERSFTRTKTTVPDACQQCFQRYCWNGTIDDRPSGTYEPHIYGSPINIESSAAQTIRQGGDAGRGRVAVLVAMILGAFFAVS